MNNQNPLIVQSDRTLLLDLHAERFVECRDALLPFAELEKSPEHLHTYRITPLSLWNATSSGFTAQDIGAVLKEFSRYDVPPSVLSWAEEVTERFGKLILLPDPKSSEKDERLILKVENNTIYREIEASTPLKKILKPLFNLDDYNLDFEYTFSLKLVDRGTIKQELMKLGWPVKDEVPLRDGESLEIRLREKTLLGHLFEPRLYQIEAAKALVGNKGPGTGFGTIVLPCGSGKTIVGMQIMSMLQTNTLILTTNISAVHQWIDELLDKTELTKEDIGEYTGEHKVIRPVTVATYQVLTWRPDKTSPFPHFQIFKERPWGLIIYDEVHLLPAPVFRVTAEIQAIRRVGLTATLVREDGCEGHVFSLVGPKRYDVPWKELEGAGWIASAECIELRIDLAHEREIEYATSTSRLKHRLASENPAKIPLVLDLVKHFKKDKILIIGQYLQQLHEIAELLNAPIITGKTPTSQRDELYANFRNGKNSILVVSKVANFAIDLPDASMAIQVSGTFGSRQEEAQRLGRILRPKDHTARFFTIITRNTVEEEFGANRQKFLAEQGYAYTLLRTNEDIAKYLEENGEKNEL